LERRGSPLAIEMAFYDGGRALTVSKEALGALRPELGARLVILAHGMAQTESCWSFPGEPQRSYGTLLREEFGLTALYLRYNTGRHVSQNGRELAVLLERLVSAAPVPVEDITLIGHSMGGLVIRSACYYAEQESLSWLARVTRAFYLGTPHLGSPYEKAGHLLSVALGVVDNPVVRLVQSLANLRSAGVKDLRHGSLLDEDWQGRDLDARDTERPHSVPLQQKIAHYLVAGSLRPSDKDVLTMLLGDALVRLPSATDPARRAGLPAEHIAVLPAIHHMMLAHSPEVYARIRHWFGEPVSEPARPLVAGPARLPRATEGLNFERIEGYRALLEDAVDRGATAIQDIQEELTRRPYSLLERIGPLEGPVEVTRSLHLAALRGTYDTIRAVNWASGRAARGALAWWQEACSAQPHAQTDTRTRGPDSLGRRLQRRLTDRD
jgi:triacylglycerol lipase